MSPIANCHYTPLSAYQPTVAPRDGTLALGGCRSVRASSLHRATRLRAVIATVMLVAVQNSTAASATLAAQPCETPATISSIDNVGTLVLAAPVQGATTVWLAGIAISERPSTLPSGPEEPAAVVHKANAAVGDIASVASAARRLLADLLSVGTVVCLDLGGPGATADRYGRLPAQVYREDGLWLQGQLLGIGLARVWPTPQARERIDEMLAVEKGARVARRGLWRLSAFRVRSSEDAELAPAGLQIVEGRVLEAERRGELWYLNFGADWRRDFTVVIGKQALAEFVRAGLEPYALKGRMIRVRGMLQRYNGPMIEVLVPQQIELVENAQG